MSAESKIPPKINDDERIIRVLMNPRHLKGELIKWNCFRSKAGLDEVSVIRIEFCNEQFCKDWGKKIEQFDRGNHYYGLAALLTKEIRSLGCDVVFTPSEQTHAFHADIVFGYVLKSGESPPSEIKFKMEELARLSRIYVDSQPDKKEWVDGIVA